MGLGPLAKIFDFLILRRFSRFCAVRFCEISARVLVVPDCGWFVYTTAGTAVSDCESQSGSCDGAVMFAVIKTLPANEP